MFTMSPVTPAEIGTKKAEIFVGPRLDLARSVGHYVAPLPEPLRSEIIMVLGGPAPVKAMVHILAGKPVLLYRSCLELSRAYDRYNALRQECFDLPAANRPLMAGTCRICGCTMDRACPSGCWWTDKSETLCLQHDA